MGVGGTMICGIICGRGGGASSSQFDVVGILNLVLGGGALRFGFN